MHNNIKPCWWGPNFWQAMFDIAAVYPEKADKNMMENTQAYFKSLQFLLPCSGCRESYTKFIREPDTDVYNINNFSTRNIIIKFLHTLRNKVNAKLELEYCITLNYFKKKLNKSLCTPDNNIEGIVSNLKEAPYIPINLESKVFNYLKKKY